MKQIMPILLLSSSCVLSACSTYEIDNNAAERNADVECTPSSGATPQDCKHVFWSSRDGRVDR